MSSIKNPKIPKHPPLVDKESCLPRRLLVPVGLGGIDMNTPEGPLPRKHIPLPPVQHPPIRAPAPRQTPFPPSVKTSPPPASYINAAWQQRGPTGLHCEEHQPTGLLAMGSDKLDLGVSEGRPEGRGKRYEKFHKFLEIFGKNHNVRHARHDFKRKGGKRRLRLCDSSPPDLSPFPHILLIDKIAEQFRDFIENYFCNLFEWIVSKAAFKPLRAFQGSSFVCRYTPHLPGMDTEVRIHYKIHYKIYFDLLQSFFGV